jgi:hypothetical protein
MVQNGKYGVDNLLKWGVKKAGIEIPKNASSEWIAN